MRKILIIFAAVLACTLTVHAVKMKDLKIYINPGHGGYDNDDRPITIYPFTQNDTLGYWESKSNLYKGLHMYHILDSLGAKPYLSRIKNRTEDDRDLGEIGREANSLGCDLFFSIHTNAGETVNYPLMLYREKEVGTPRYPEAITLSNILWDNLHSSKLSLWTRDNRYVSGDLTFYPQWGTSGLGVLRQLYVVGLLSEGGMHEHKPEAHRLMNDDFWWLEAWHFVKTIMDFYDTEDKFVTGNVAGVIYDDNNTREETLQLSASAYGRDRNKPINGAYIELRDLSGKVIQKRTTDNMNNGLFVFRNVTPGNYKLVVSRDAYYTYEKEISVVANQVTYNDVPFSLKRETPLVLESYSPQVEPGTLVSCAESIVLNFNHDISVPALEKGFKIEPAVEGEFTYSKSYHTVKFKPLVAFDLNTHYKVTLTTDIATPDPYYEKSHFEKDFSFEFDTKGRNKLELIKTFPEEGGAVHYKNAALEFRFDKRVDATGIFNKISIFDKNNNKIGINARLSGYNKLSNGYGNVILSLNGDLKVGESYKVVLSPEIKDEEGIPLTDEYVINFKANNEGDVKEGEVLETFESVDVVKYNSEESTGLESEPETFLMTSKYLFDKASVKMTYSYANIKGGVMVADYNNGMKIVMKGDKVGIHVFGDLNDHELFLGFTAGTDTKYFKVCNLNFVGWKYFEIELETLESGVEYLFSKIKLHQSEGLYAQKGGFHCDNMILTSKGGGVEDVNINNSVSVYPNPATDKITICGIGTDANIEFYNLQGVAVMRATGTSINISNLSQGVYMIVIKDGARQIVKSIIKK